MNIAPQILLSLFAQCAADVAPETLNTLINVESSRNPYAIAVVYDKSVKDSDKLTFSQPSSEDEALRIIDQLTAKKTHKSYSVGIMQVNSTNFQKYGITRANMFDACKNISTGAKIFQSCYETAKQNSPQEHEQTLLRRAASCYYAGNEIRGYQPDYNGTSYIDRINALVANSTYKVPAIKPLNTVDEAHQQKIKPPKIISAWDVFGDFSQ